MGPKHQANTTAEQALQPSATHKVSSGTKAAVQTAMCADSKSDRWYNRLTHHSSSSHRRTLSVTVSVPNLAQVVRQHLLQGPGDRLYEFTVVSPGLSAV